MGITGVASTYQYYYNNQTGKLQSADGTQEDEFVKWFNGDTADDELPDSLSGYDERKKTAIQGHIEMVQKGMINGSQLEGEGLYRITYELTDAVTEMVSIEGVLGLSRITPLNYSREQLKKIGDSSAYATTAKKPYDPETNSTTIVRGDTFDLGNGHKLVIRDNCVDVVDKNGKDATKYASEYTLKMRAGMETFMKFTNQTGLAGLVWNKVEGYEQEFLDLIKTTGVDATKEFTINQTKCVADDEGRIRESENVFVMPNSMYYEQLKRYEEFWGIPINKRVGNSIEECLKAYNKL